MHSVRAILTGIACVALAAGQAGPALSIDAAAGRRPISPGIYGINFYWDLGSATGNGGPDVLDIRPTMRRWGGNSTSTYHWKYDIHNLANDWYFEVLPDKNPNAAKLPEGSSFNAFVDQALSTGGIVMGTIPVLGWLPKARMEMCSYETGKYGNQCQVDPYAPYHPVHCGNGVVASATCSTKPLYIQNDPNDAYAQYDETFQADWVKYVVSRYGKANQGGVSIWALDNEPIWWDSTHRDIHPDPYTYDEVLSLDIRYGEAVKRADPTALIAGPVGDNWASLWFSKKDIVAGQARGNYWSNPVDRNAHGGTPFLAWYLQQMREYERTHGMRLLDYLDQHAYLAPANVAFSAAGDAKTQAARLDSTRVFWDPTYKPTGDYWIKDTENNGAPVAPQFIPRLRDIVAQNYPGTKIAITEYNWGALDNMNGALAQADLLGIFGREALDAATLWGPPKPTDPGAFAFRIYRNYDGIGGAFGETAVQASSDDQGKLAVYASLRSDSSLTAIVINKTAGDLASTVKLANFAAAPAVQVWQYSAASTASIVRRDDAAISDGAIAAVFPANSITLLVVTASPLPVPRPRVTAVANAASYAAAVAPGQIVTVWGSGMGPDKLAGPAVDGNGMVTNTVAGARILFDGIPAPLIYVSASQSSAVVPYLASANATTRLQVEYQGVRSEPLEIPIAPTAPGLFTADSSGVGQGAILNEDGTRNSTAVPARPGSVVVLWGTGEGLTDPPGVDGRPASVVLPHPLAPVTVQIGGASAAIEYAGAAPGNVAGVFQINARVPAGVTGDRVPVKVTVGGKPSQDGVTVAIH